MRLTVQICGLVLALAMLAAACGGGGGGDSGAAPQPEPAPPADTSSESANAGEVGQAEPPADPPSAPPDPAPAEAPPAGGAAEPGTNGPRADEAVACEETVVPSQVPLDDGTSHVEQLPDGFEYNSIPASQGPHHPEWLRWGVYEVPVPELNLVHNLEHGGLSVQYGPGVSDETLALLLDWYIRDAAATIVAPHDGLGSDIALAAWTVEDIDQGVDALYRSSEGNVLRCDGFQEEAFSDFRERNRGRAPERIPVELMQPGTL